jgi:hypothetical protein
MHSCSSYISAYIPPIVLSQAICLVNDNVASATCSAKFFPENHHNIPNTIAKIMQIFDMMEGLTSQWLYFWFTAWLKSKPQKWLIQFLSAKMGPLTFRLFYPIKYFDNFSNFI